jgi:Flp pilus assembly protein TadD
MQSFSPRLLALLLCGAALCGCSTPSGPSGEKDKLSDKVKPVSTQLAAQNDVDGNLRQAKLLRLAGEYDQAITVLSQLMLVASDNPQVVAEYGKALAQKGRAEDATQFLSRAIELSPNDWTLYSALGVSYDQIGDQDKARTAYEHALALKPDEAGVLNNYALSRMLAKDPQGAKILITKAQANSPPDDKKIAQNVAMIDSHLPKPEAPKVQAPVLASGAGQKNAVMATTAKPVSPETNADSDARRIAQAMVSSAPLSSPISKPAPSFDPQPTGAPRSLTPPPQQQPVSLPSQVAIASLAPIPPYPDVVMQKVPIDPHAGPVALHTAKPTPKAIASIANAAPAKPASAKTDAPAKVQVAAQAKLSVPANAPAATQVKLTAPAKVQVATQDKLAVPDNVQIPLPDKVEVDAPAKAPVTTQATIGLPVKTAAKKDDIPALRMAADKY